MVLEVIRKGTWDLLGRRGLLLTPKALHSTAQGRASAPWGQTLKADLP